MLGEYYIKVNDDVYLSSTTILGIIPDSIDDMIATEDSESTETESEQQRIDKLQFEKKLRNSSSFFNEIGIEIMLMLYHYYCVE